MISIAENLKRVNERIAHAAEGCGRDLTTIKLVAVSKFKSAGLIREAYIHGQHAFGENYAQDLRDKAALLRGLNICWHFIGHLQTNKAKYVAPVAGFVETVDSIELANNLNKRAVRRIPCLIEVNTGNEASKSGVAPAEILPLARHMLTLENLDLRGLMTIPPFVPNPEKSRPYFRNLRELLADLNSSLPLETPLAELSMGMSHDFEVAIEEGATIVRVGTAIFGERI